MNAVFIYRIFQYNEDLWAAKGKREREKKISANIFDRHLPGSEVSEEKFEYFRFYKTQKHIQVLCVCMCLVSQCIETTRKNNE